MIDLVRTMEWPPNGSGESEPLLEREWLVTNGLGGYASGTVSDVITRRYHGLLIAALPAPLGRTMMLNDLLEQVRLPDGTRVLLGGKEKAAGPHHFQAAGFLTGFRLEQGLPVWRYEVAGFVIEKRLLVLHRQNTVHVTYRLLEGEGSLRLVLCPAVHFRPHDAPVSSPHEEPYALTIMDERYEISGGSHLPSLRIVTHDQPATFTVDRNRIGEILYRIEESRGYEARGDLWSPGYFQIDLTPGQRATLVASTESWETIAALRPREAYLAELQRRRNLLADAQPQAREGMGAELVLAADQFLITPAGRVEDEARAHAAGYETRTVIAGYHWFTDWGRDTMISLEGLTLVTGRHAEACSILQTFAYYVKDGLLPNMFPEGKKEGLYHTADATLWFFHAIDRYLEVTGDRALLKMLLPKLKDIVDHHVRGTRFGIGVDAEDGLLRQGQEGYQLTWMDAKVGDWVVTPRRGKAVELNALWYNALRLLSDWLSQEEGEEAGRPLAERAEEARRSFNARFWYPQGGHLFDVVDGEKGDDPACRPNQVLSISLRHPVLDRDRWEPVMEVVRKRLLTPRGLRTLSPDHPDYKSKYYGDLRARDAAYHQGTVWPWILGPYVDAWLKLHPQDRDGARRLVSRQAPHLGEACLGTISEIFDAEEPYTPRGCVAQAWSVAEVLRAWVKTGEPA